MFRKSKRSKNEVVAPKEEEDHIPLSTAGDCFDNRTQKSLFYNAVNQWPHFISTAVL